MFCYVFDTASEAGRCRLPPPISDTNTAFLVRNYRALRDHKHTDAVAIRCWQVFPNSGASGPVTFACE